MKKRRNTWSCPRPVTQVVPNRKKKTRQQLRKELKDLDGKIIRMETIQQSQMDN